MPIAMKKQKPKPEIEFQYRGCSISWLDRIANIELWRKCNQEPMLH